MPRPTAGEELNVEGIVERDRDRKADAVEMFQLILCIIVFLMYLSKFVKRGLNMT